MGNITRARLPGSFYLVIGVGVLVALAAVWFSLVSPGSWTFRLRNRPKLVEKAQLNVKVWADKQSGYYYCSDNRMNGRTGSGRYMTQGEALQEGYTPSMGLPCR